MKFLALIFLMLFYVQANAQMIFEGVDKDFSKTNIGNIHTGKNEIILSFDDGPTPGVTDKILDILGEYNIKATFFVIGANVKAHPALMKRILDEGHIVGNHSMTHLALKNLDPETWKNIVTKEVMDTHKLLLPYLGNNKHFYFRAPYSNWSKSFAEFLNETEIGKEYIGPILWDVGGELELVDGKLHQAADWACWSKKISIDDCMEGYIYEATQKKGGVFLMHDLRNQSALMLEKMIPELEDRGFVFTSLNDVNWK